MDRTRHRGQASVELIGVAIGLGVVTMLAWQLIVAAQAWQSAQSAAAAAARADTVGAPAVRAARAVLPTNLAQSVQVRTRTLGSRRVVDVRVRVPQALPFGPPLGWVTGSAEVAP